MTEYVQETFKALQQTPWQEDVRPLIQALEHRLRLRMVDLISKAYSQIRLEKGSALLGLPSEQLLQGTACCRRESYRKGRGTKGEGGRWAA